MKEVTADDWEKNPTSRMMWVWDGEINAKEKKKVIYVKRESSSIYPVIAVEQYNDSLVTFRHCAEIEEPKTRRMTNQEFAWWLQDGIKECKHREWKYEKEPDPTVRSIMNYIEVQTNDFVSENVLIRENGGEWREPLVEVEE